MGNKYLSSRRSLICLFIANILCFSAYAEYVTYIPKDIFYQYVNRSAKYKEKYQLPIGYVKYDTLKDLYLKTECTFYEKETKTYWKAAKTWGDGEWDIWISYSPDGRKWAPFYFVPIHYEYLHGNNWLNPLTYIHNILLPFVQFNPSKNKISMSKYGNNICIKNRINILGITEKSKIVNIDIDSIFLDSDNDGLTNAMEADMNTDAFNADTDGDGVTDGVDMNPLTISYPESDSSSIRQGAFNWFLSKYSDSCLPIYYITDTSAIKQEYKNSYGYVLPRKEVYYGRMNIEKLKIDSINGNIAVVIFDVFVIPLDFGYGWKLYLVNDNGSWVVEKAQLIWIT
jgi:hypothetical protein